MMSTRRAVKSARQIEEVYGSEGESTLYLDVSESILQV